MGLLDDDFDVDPCVKVSVGSIGAMHEVAIIPMPETPYTSKDGTEHIFHGSTFNYTVWEKLDLITGVIRYKLRRIPLSKLPSSIEQVCRQSIHRHVRNCFNIKEISATEWRVTGRITKYSKPCGFAIKIIE